MSKNIFQTVSTGVFDRYSGKDLISERAFFATLGVVLCYGFFMTAWIASTTVLSNVGWGMIILVGLVIPIVGIIISVRSDNPIVSFIGYNMIVIPFGIILSPVLHQYSPRVVQDAFLITGIDVVTMAVLATIYPNFFKNLGGALFMALTGLLVVRVLQIFIPALAGLTIVDWISAGIFSLYVGFDWYRATSVTKTYDNAVDIAVDLYLDIINLFLSILKILGKKD